MSSSPHGKAEEAPQATQQAFKIGNYIIGETLGKGSFGKVKLATHEVTGHRVAVKILNRQKIKNSQMDKKIKREITVLKLFRHPHIIRLYDVMETTTDIFMIMEYVNKGELFDYIVQNGKLTEPAARRFFQQIVSGVEYCHHYQVAHRDLKPENLLLDSEMNVKIADFGLSNLMKDGDFLKTSCGSPNYAAPEVVSGMLYAGPEVDVWSCGVILYALLCGRLPFDEDSIPALFQKIKAGKYSLPTSMPPGPRDIIKKVLVVDPMKRMTLAEIRQTDWFQQDLPAYLQMSPAQMVEQHEQAVDEAVVKQVAIKLDLAEDKVRTEINAGEESQQYDVALAYNILLDAKRRKELYEMKSVSTPTPVPNTSFAPSTEGTTSLSSSSLPPNCLQSSPVIDLMVGQMSATHTKFKYNKSKFVVPSSVPSSFGGTNTTSVASSPPFRSYIRQGLSSSMTAAAMAKSAPGVRSFVTSPTGASSLQGDGMVFPLDDGLGQSGSLQMPPRSDSLGGDESSLGYLAHHGCGWRLGLMSEKRSADIMDSIYTILIEKKMAWKVISPYHLSVRSITYKTGGIKVGIRLYRMNDRHDKGFLIDLTRIDGSIVPTMDLISQLHDCFQTRVA